MGLEKKRIGVRVEGTQDLRIRHFVSKGRVPWVPAAGASEGPKDARSGATMQMVQTATTSWKKSGVDEHSLYLEGERAAGDEALAAIMA